jgi:hypothetical protein
MRFEWMREGPADACSDRCREWISASGQIVATTARLFADFARGRDVRGAVIVMESPGGHVGASLALGQLFRRLGVTTTVGHTTTLTADASGAQRATLSGKAACASACVFAFLGGAHRSVPAEARLFVHQIWPVNKREDALATVYSAVEMVTIQRQLGMVARYIVDMGGHIALFETAMRIPPWEQIKVLTVDEVRLMGLHDTDDPFGQPRPSPSAVATQTATAAAQPGAAIADLGWTAVQRENRQSLVRKHILTMESIPIGSFELSLTCGISAGNYALAYSETRRLLSQGAADRLRAVVVAAANQRVQLRIDQSAADSPSTELRSKASGEIPASLLSDFANSGGNGLLVATQTAGNARTIIRVGNSGFAESFKRTLAECAK